MSFYTMKISETAVSVKGTIDEVEIFLFTLSTCQWCKKAKEWFIKNNFSFRYLDMDLLPIEERRQLKRQLRHTFNTLIKYPFVIINDAYYLGYTPNEWKASLEFYMRPKKQEKNLEEVKEYVSRVAKIRKWKINPNIDGTLDLLIEGLLTNFNRYGYYNCPCRESQNDKKLDRDIICPCDYAEEDIKEYGHCYCALYFDPDFNFKENEINMIPERRSEPNY